MAAAGPGSPQPYKQHLSLVVAGHVDAGKSTSTGRLLYELGGVSDREIEKLKAEAVALGKPSFFLANIMMKTREERDKGVTIGVSTKEFFTDSFHYTIIDCPGHRDFVKNMISGASQADIGMLMVPADGNFVTSIQKGSHKSGTVDGQTRQHARLLNLLGLKQLIICVNKMDEPTAGYREERFIECRDEARHMLRKAGWSKDAVENQVPIIPISGFKGDNFTSPSDNMPWWKGADVTDANGGTVHVNTLVDVLNKWAKAPTRNAGAPLRAPVSGAFKIKGVGDVITCRIEQGTIKPGDTMKFIPSHSDALPCTGKVLSIEMHHQNVEAAGPGDNVGLNFRGLPKDNMPRAGDVMVLATDKSLDAAKSFQAQVQVLAHPGELKVGYTPIGCVRTSKAPCKLTKIIWRMGKATGGAKLEDAQFIKAGEVALCEFEPVKPIAVDSFKSCEGLGRIALMEGNGLVMMGKITTVSA